MSEELHRRIDDIADDLLSCKTEVGKELERGNIKFDKLNKKITELEVKIDHYIKRVEDFIIILEAAEGFFKVLGVIGAGLKWVVGIAIAIAALWTYIKTGYWHK